MDENNAFQKYCQLYIVRHGETEWNTKRLLQGQNDSPLTENGVNQAKELGKTLKKIRFDGIFSSDLLRAQKTAEIIALERNLAVETNKLLRERYFGRFQGKTVEEMREELRDQLKKREVLSKEERFKFRVHNEVETDEEIISRFITFLREMAVAYPNKNVLVVSHGAMIYALLIHLGFAEYHELRISQIKNTSCVIIQSDGVDFFIKEVFGLDR